MSCTKNKKQFWIFKWLGPHTPVTTTIMKVFDNEYEVNKKCSKCECSLSSGWWVSESDMIQNGYSVEKLQKMSSLSFKLTDAKDLRSD